MRQSPPFTLYFQSVVTSVFAVIVNVEEANEYLGLYLLIKLNMGVWCSNSRYFIEWTSTQILQISIENIQSSYCHQRLHVCSISWFCTYITIWLPLLRTWYSYINQPVSSWHSHVVPFGAIFTKSSYSRFNSSAIYNPSWDIGLVFHVSVITHYHDSQSNLVYYICFGRLGIF